MVFRWATTGYAGYKGAVQCFVSVLSVNTSLGLPGYIEQDPVVIIRRVVGVIRKPGVPLLRILYQKRTGRWKGIAATGYRVQVRSITIHYLASVKTLVPANRYGGSGSCSGDMVQGARMMPGGLGGIFSLVQSITNW